jgi:hypothetical protein
MLAGRRNEMKRFFFFTCLVLLSMGVPMSHAEDIAGLHIYEPYLQQKVEMQGMLWEQGKGLWFYITTPWGDRIYISEEDVDDQTMRSEFQGRLVAVQGKLTLETMPGLPETTDGLQVQGYVDSFQYLKLSDYSIRTIDKVVSPITSLED